MSNSTAQGGRLMIAAIYVTLRHERGELKS
jgi:hypothetical protein